MSYKAEKGFAEQKVELSKGRQNLRDGFLTLTTLLNKEKLVQQDWRDFNKELAKFAQWAKDSQERTIGPMQRRTFELGEPQAPTQKQEGRLQGLGLGIVVAILEVVDFVAFLDYPDKWPMTNMFAFGAIWPLLMIGRYYWEPLLALLNNKIKGKKSETVMTMLDKMRNIGMVLEIAPEIIVSLQLESEGDVEIQKSTDLLAYGQSKLREKLESLLNQVYRISDNEYENTQERWNEKFEGTYGNQQKQGVGVTQ